MDLFFSVDVAINICSIILLNISDLLDGEFINAKINV